MAVNIPKNGQIEAFAMIVDINSFTKIVSKSEGNSIAQYIRDILSGGIDAVEKYEGEVVGFMGDAFLAILPTAESVFLSCVSIAKDLDRLCEYLSDRDWKADYQYKGPSLKIGIEYGLIDTSTIYSEFLGEQVLLIGDAINYASRITLGGRGNRCLVGPKAIEQGLLQWSNHGPYVVKGKKGEQTYTYYQLELGDIWREGSGKETYWG
ncbi:adenylate/guanylate cyclase domain-containing protein [Spirosoma radiotolerans]|uniref:Guanylate cyclase domain-containing protein n=1 Tax=Spirosoma radiotolerans TaxID=1379870 RepID=A0A0E3V515_9BACT|nr:adenylate/guanylate cyclase domain-containing protein [Spirosoma radiotolerans]AKD53792.1 hypothetical protein SD10_01620 [Spirosoma radiotolerans]